ncbi:SRPBCC domain-containing protein [Thalassoglobus sp. JC818]|uniref:SRPBCC domain-containing protein n=1 Tax=Thalassoglobus sp. JC818 TaxID=3232136 RepID=UPI003458154D
MQTTAVSTPVETQVEVVRSFDSTIDSVWKTFTEPDLVSRWMLGPPGWSMPVCEMDFRVGGKYENRFRNDDDGMEFGLSGEFREIAPLRKIVQDECYGGGHTEEDMSHSAVVTISFEDHGGETTVATLVEYPSREARDAALATGMTESMEMGYRRIDELLAG